MVVTPAPPNKAMVMKKAKAADDKLHLVEIPGRGHVGFPLPKKSRCCLSVTITTLITVLVICIAATAILFSCLAHGKSPRFGLYTVSFSRTKYMTVTMSVSNPRDHVRVSLGHKHSRVSLAYNGLILGQGVFPGVDLSPMSPLSAPQASLAPTAIWGMHGHKVFNDLANDEAQRRVPLTLDIRAPVKFKIGLIKTWPFVSRIHCDFTVDRLTDNSTLNSQPYECHYDVSLW